MSGQVKTSMRLTVCPMILDCNSQMAGCLLYRITSGSEILPVVDCHRSWSARTDDDNIKLCNYGQQKWFWALPATATESLS